ncbi:unnamed protein product [Rodentolepis nana]|uniref:Uncharacterized protein n=1 Tax=Rodentolepis nana TaxID=102285 RepID=A0A0R3THN1_RODNA|nr:unnamed protein product [Rodentolepis nana]
MRRCRKYCQNISKKMGTIFCFCGLCPTSSRCSKSSLPSSSSASDYSSSSSSSSNQHGNSFNIDHIFAPRTATSDGNQHSNGLSKFAQHTLKWSQLYCKRYLIRMEKK